MKISILIFALLGFPNNSMAESPSYLETRDYIIDIMSYESAAWIYRKDGTAVWEKKVFLEHARCIFQDRAYHGPTASGEKRFFSAQRIDFSAVLPGSFTGEYRKNGDGTKSYVINFKFNRDAKDGLWYWRDGSWKNSVKNILHPWMEISGNQVEFYGPKLVRAFRHFSELCGAKKDLF